MSDGSGSYSRFFSGDRDAIEEVIKDYKDGLILLHLQYYRRYGVVRGSRNRCVHKALCR